MYCSMVHIINGAAVSAHPVDDVSLLYLHVCSYKLRNADFMARYLSTVTSDEIRSQHFAMELLSLRQHFWEFSNNSITIAC